MKVEIFTDPEAALWLEPETPAEAIALERWHLAVHEQQLDREGDVPTPVHLVALTDPKTILLLVCTFERFARIFFGLEPMPAFTDEITGQIFTDETEGGQGATASVRQEDRARRPPGAEAGVDRQGRHDAGSETRNVNRPRCGHTEGESRMQYTVYENDDGDLWLKCEPRSAEEVQQLKLLANKFGRPEPTYEGGPYWLELAARPGGPPPAGEVVESPTPLRDYEAPTEPAQPPIEGSGDQAPGPAPGPATAPETPPGGPTP